MSDKSDLSKLELKQIKHAVSIYTQNDSGLYDVPASEIFAYLNRKSDTYKDLHVGVFKCLCISEHSICAILLVCIFLWLPIFLFGIILPQHGKNY